VGDLDGVPGRFVGLTVGLFVGTLMGLFVGYWMGLSVGDLDEEFGLTDDFSVGLAVGFGVGLSDKKLVDHMVGTCVGLEVLSGKKIAEVQVSALNLPRFLRYLFI